MAAVAALQAVAIPADAHGVGEGDAGFIEANEGLAVGPFLYLGAKHMVTGYDHLLFLVGVIFTRSTKAQRTPPIRTLAPACPRSPTR